MVCNHALGFTRVVETREADAPGGRLRQSHPSTLEFTPAAKTSKVFGTMFTKRVRQRVSPLGVMQRVRQARRGGPAAIHLPRAYMGTPPCLCGRAVPQELAAVFAYGTLGQWCSAADTESWCC